MKKTSMDGNTAAASVAYAFSDVSAIYPITPSSTMAELVDEWSANGRKNLFGNEVEVVEMQSEAGAAGAVHGSLISGMMTTTFTASQGLLLMIPNMYKIAGEFLPSVFHVAARALSTHALSIFGDHSDIYACRGTGFGMICSSSPQEAMDLSLVSHLSSINSSVPFIHFFDGFRTSHEIQKIDEIELEDIRQIVNFQKIEEFRKKGLNPDRPCQMGTAQNPDIYFQNREAGNNHYSLALEEVKKAMKDVEKITGRKYLPFDYYGAPDAENLIVMMGSGSDTVEEYIDFEEKNGKKLGLVKVRLFRPFSASDLLAVIPSTTKSIAVLDRTKESGSEGEPLLLDVSLAISESNRKIRVIGGRYGLGGKEFTPKCAKAVFDNLILEKPKNHFTVGINDDVTHLSLPISDDFEIRKNDYEMKFFGLGSDGTVSANKNSIKIIGESTNKFVQGYFEYDSKKSGSLTTSHLRTSDEKIKSTYLLENADFIAIHNFSFIGKYDLLKGLKQNGIVLLNTTEDESGLSAHLPSDFVEILKEKNAQLFTIDASDLATRNNLGTRINVIMQTAFFKVSNVIDFSLALEKIREATKKTYGKKGEAVVNANLRCIDETVEKIRAININNLVGHDKKKTKKNDEYYDDFIAPIEEKNGDSLPVSAFSADGRVPTDTSKFEKRGIALEIPCWKKENCIQCGRCVISCPHSALKAFAIKKEDLKNAPNSFETSKGFGYDGEFRIQLSPEDCTGCSVCSRICPAKNPALLMTKATDILENEKENYAFTNNLKTIQTPFPKNSPKGLQFLPSYFKFSGACAGCGETPYIRLLTQLFGEKMLIANATGCSSIYGGSAPTCPYSKDDSGKGPAWASSLFEDNAEFGLGMAIANRKTGNKKSVWLIGGDGWAYDIGYGGVDHVLSSNENVNILVLDTEVYSNTGGQASKSTPKGSVAKFASGGKRTKKKDLGMIAVAAKNAYVASISLGYDQSQAIRALTEAEAYNGPSIVIAYAPCINHGINLSNSAEEMKKAVECGYFTPYRFNPQTMVRPEIDSPEPSGDYQAFLLGENRFRALSTKHPETAKELFAIQEKEALDRRKTLETFD